MYCWVTSKVRCTQRARVRDALATKADGFAKDPEMFWPETHVGAFHCKIEDTTEEEKIIKNTTSSSVSYQELTALQDVWQVRMSCLTTKASIFLLIIAGGIYCVDSIFA